MPEGMDGAAVLESPEVSQAEVSEDVSTESAETEGEKLEQSDKADNRRQPDALKKHIADLRRQAETITDPIEKKAALDRIKMLYDTTGKARGYEEVFPTVREAREFKALLDAAGGREGFQQMQTTLSEIEKIDAQLAAGDPTVANRLWDEAPDGMPKIIPSLLDRYAKEKPQEYQQFIAPKSIGYLDQNGFPQAFDRMVQLYEAGKTEDAQMLRDQLIQFVVGNRQAAQQQKQADPEVERLRHELEQLKQGGESQKVEAAYNSVLDHASSAIDTTAKPIIGKYGLTKDEMSAFRSAVWDHLEKSRNANDTYKTVAPAKVKQGYNKFIEYANRWTDDNADASIRAVLKTPPWSRLTASQKTVPAVTKAPGATNIQQGKQPAPSEIDYSPKGLQLVRKAGFKDIQDALLSGQAPLKTGTLRKWR